MQYLIAIACLALLTLTGCVQQPGTRPINSGELGYVLTNTANGLRAGQQRQTQTYCTQWPNGAVQCTTQ